MLLVKERQSNWEMLRIIAMLGIVTGHFFYQSGLIGALNGIDRFVAMGLGSTARIFVNVFIMIGCWFMVDSKFRTERIIRLYFQMWYYCFIIVVVLLLLGYDVARRDIISMFLPFSFGPWFVTSYLALLLISPFLQNLLYLPKIELKRLVTTLFCLICLVSTFHKATDVYLDTISWFIFIYLFIGYYKKYIVLNMNKWLVLFLAVVGGGILFTIEYLQPKSMIGVISHQFITDYKSLPCFLISLCIFYFFQKVDIGYKKWINLIARSALAVYLIHQGPGFKDILWFDIFKANSFIHEKYALIWGVGVVFYCYICCTLVDLVRLKIFEPIFMNSSMYTIIQTRMNKFYDFTSK